MRFLLAGATAAAGLTFTAPALTSSGYAPGTISGYAVSDVVYDQPEPGQVQAIELTLDRSAMRVDVRLTRRSGWTSCVAEVMSRWRCHLADTVRVKDIRRLEVVASGP